MKRLFKFIGILFLAFVLSSISGVLYYKIFPVKYTPLMVLRYISPKGTSEQAKMEKSWRHEWVPISEITPNMPLAVRSSEDARFYVHNGFDTIEIKNAIREAEKGGRRRGASTISQQTAKNVFLWPESSWLRKGLEVWFTILIENIWGKDRIMEVYLNSIEMGPGIYGVEAAAQYYFNTNASNLTKRQCALIAAALPNPIERNPGNPSNYLNKRARKIVRMMSQQPARIGKK